MAGPSSGAVVGSIIAFAFKNVGEKKKRYIWEFPIIIVKKTINCGRSTRKIIRKIFWNFHIRKR
jgi:hypothetical protein